MDARSLVCFLFLLVGTTLAATPTCKKINDCACTPTDVTNVTGVINFFPLVQATGAKPMYMVNGTSQQTKLNYTFSYNPCMGFNISGTSTDPCTNDLLCQTDLKYKFVYDIGAVGHTQFAYVNNDLFAYYYSNSTNNRTSEVRLICDESETTGKFTFVGEMKELYYQFNFTTMCACPGKCPNKTIIPDMWIATDDSCMYRQLRSGKVVNLQGLNTILKVSIDDYTAYYYNPCNELEMGSFDDECKDVAICQQDTSTSPSTYQGIGGKKPEMKEEDGDLVLHYPTVNSGQDFNVKLICDQSADVPMFTAIFKNRAILISKYACPQ